MKVFTICLLTITAVLLPLSAGGQKEDNGPSNTMMAMEDSGDMPGSMEPFIPYKDPEQAMMLAGEKPTVLFFYASWCPDCRAAREDFTAGSSALHRVNLILVDYDNSEELKKKYAVTYQHTFVRIDDLGTALDVWSGGGTEELLARIGEGEM